MDTLLLMNAAILEFFSSTASQASYVRLLLERDDYKWTHIAIVGFGDFSAIKSKQ